MRDICHVLDDPRQLRYDTKVIEIAKAKSAIELGERRQLMPVIEALKQAVEIGEVDQQLTTAEAEVSKRCLKIQQLNH